MSLETFTDLSHALTTLWRDSMGEIDKVLNEHNLERRAVARLLDASNDGAELML
ncbi:hypothetical protein [Myxacorys almedinensis]|uniref:Uncharacterized protein n=1 Tax=Myxacorys almedinensis A TaxID=2690445 RepID=A0A8J7Z474_9CYAN|nr:hypothetical protein [Myxacorys almedinensis]NDJ19434.1 hypothetical protein [Myxacorys almedinensis A]